ncbi:glycoside hydrolase family 13 protein [Pontibacillus yanchengensis]|uniref:Glycoside hydrolase family 13 protein n=2 Tax=Pontibacillus yanchengensis TaxID=462910 RepID=A0ACC7VHA1_9BACI|nr:glycoside hydrolase family 13 protein [Pontibacillus yanchengensis]MYL54306.1 glycoside hydrolase family 13 protein [Pontibacillus yanchengensis]
MKQHDMYHNSFLQSYREPFGAAPRGSNVSLTIDVHNHHQVQKVIVHYIYDKSDEEQTKELDLYSEKHYYNSFEATIKMPDEPQLVWYYFEIVLEEYTFFYGRLSIEESGEGVLYEHIPPSWQITVYDPEYQTPRWWKNATMYQIFPDRFHVEGDPELEKAPKSSLMHTHWENDPYYIRDENGGVVRWDFFGGNIQGIIHKLDYIKSLGVTVIYLNPIFEAESNHRYDTGDYHKIDLLLGTKEDFEQLIAEAKDRGIEIMLDGVFSHTGSNSIYFNQRNEYDSLGAYQSKSSPYYDWYMFHEWPDEYEAWWGVGTLPTLNKEVESYQQFLVHNEDSVIKTWQQSGMNHWRLDVADELTDDLIRQIYQQLKTNDESSVLLGEVWEDASNKSAYGKRREYFLGGVLDSVMNYPLRDLMLDFIKGEVDAYFLHRRLLTLREHYPREYFYALMNMLSSHDVERVKTMLDAFLPDDLLDEERRNIIQQQVKALSLWLYTFPGIPSLYYGDEAGVTGGKDPDNRKPFPWGREEKELVHWYTKIGQWRSNHAALRTGSFKPHALHEDVYAYERWVKNGVDEFGKKANNEHMLYLINRNYQEEIEVTLSIRKGRWQHMLDHRMFRTKKGKLTITLAPCESMLLRHIH